MRKRKIFKDIDPMSYISAITSGILTNILYGDLFPCHYEKKIADNGTTLFEPIEEYNLWQKLLIILSIFLILWFILYIVFPFIINLAKSLSRKKRIIYTSKDIVCSYKNINTNVQNLIERNQLLLSISNVSNTVLASEISHYINELDRLFIEKNNVQQKIINSAFRHGNTINDINKYISYYEFHALIDNVDALFHSIFPNQTNNNNLQQNNNNNLQQKDCSNLEEKLEKLKTFAMESTNMIESTNI